MVHLSQIPLARARHEDSLIREGAELTGDCVHLPITKEQPTPLNCARQFGEWVRGGGTKLGAGKIAADSLFPLHLGVERGV